MAMDSLDPLALEVNLDLHDFLEEDHLFHLANEGVAGKLPAILF